MNVESSRAGANSLSGVDGHAPSVRHLRWTTRLFTILLAVLINPATAEAATNRVPSEYATIQAGINASMHGDTVLVASGVYNGNGNRDIQFGGRRILVHSEAGAESTIIDCEGTAENPHRGFHFGALETNESVLRGFTIRNGYAIQGSPGSQDGAGIRVNGSSQGPIIEDCIVTQCKGTSAVYVYALRTILRRCSIVDNEAKGVQLEVAWLVEECLISGNLLKGIDVNYVGELLRSRIVGNNGCGVYVEGNEFAVIRDCLITGNRDVGVRAIYTSGLLIEGCSIVGNDGPAGVAGGVRLEDCQWATIRKCVIRENCWNDVQLTSESDVTFECCAIDPSAVTGSGDVAYDGPQVTADPLLCTVVDCEDAPTTEGDYHLQPGSPCLPESSPCGERIGALGEGCDVSSSPGPQKGADNLFPRVGVETWPNPARDAVSMRLAIPGGTDSGAFDFGAGGKSPIEIRIFTASGSECRRVVRTVEQLGSPVEIDTRDLNPGVYFVRMRTPNTEASGRFLISR